MLGNKLLAACLTTALSAAVTIDYALATPSGATVVHGSANINSSGNTLTVTNTPGTVINWQQFNIGQNEVTRFIQQSASSSVLNRVTGGDISQIHGQLQSNGQVYLVNPHGILFGQNAVIDTAGLIATTLNISNHDFLDGKLRFHDLANSAEILNQGFIHTSNEGEVMLIAPTVTNEGTIEVEQGNITLVAGKSVTIDSLHLDAISFEVQAPEDAAVNLGELMSDGGSIGVFAGSIRNEGVVSANAITVDDAGVIRFVAQTDNVQLDATVTAVGSNGQGGEIDVLGDRVGVFGDTLIDASGRNGGGTVHVGGEYQGQGDKPTATTTQVGENAEIRADGIVAGDGGEVIVWADDYTLFHGDISSRGGAGGGDGGFVEVSGKNDLNFTGFVDVLAPVGTPGSLLLDPNNIFIQVAPGANDGLVSVGGDTIDFLDNPGADVTIGEGVLEALTGSVILEAEIDIDVQAGVTLDFTNQDAGNNVTFRAGRSILVNGDITTAGGNITLSAADLNAASPDAGGLISISGKLDSGGGNIALNTNASSLGTTVNNDIDAGSGTIDILSSAGTSVIFTGGTVTAGTLGSTSGLVFEITADTTFAAPSIANAFIDVSAGILTMPQSTTLTQNLIIDGSTAQVNVTGTLGIGNQLQLNQGSLTTGGDITVTGLTTWNPPSLAGADEPFLIDGTGSLFANGGFNLGSNLAGDTLTLNKDLVIATGGIWSDSGGPNVTITGTGSITNNTSIDVQNDALLDIDVSFTNSSGATLTKSAGSGIFRFTGQFDNEGTFQSIFGSGPIELDGGGTHTGTFDIGSNFFLTSGTHSFEPGSSVIGNGTFTNSGADTTFSDSSGGIASTIDLTVDAGSLDLGASSGNLGTVLIDFSSAVLSTAATNITTLNLSQGTLTLSGDVNVQTLNWDQSQNDSGAQNFLINGTGGKINVSTAFNITTQTSADTLTLNRDLNLLNGSTSTWTDGDSGNIINGSGKISLSGALDLQNSRALTIDTFVDISDTGTFDKSTGGGNVFITDIFSDGTLSIQSATLLITGSLPFDNEGTVVVTGTGELDVSAGGLRTSGNLTGDGRVTGNVINNGFLGPDTDSDITVSLTIDGDLTLLDRSILAYDLGGLTQVTDYDLIDVTGAVILGGRLTAEWSSGFFGTDGNTFDLIQAANGLSGEFIEVFTPLGVESFTQSFDTISSPNVYSITTNTVSTNIFNWTELGDGVNWNDPNNWSGPALRAPGAGDYAFIDDGIGIVNIITSDDITVAGVTSFGQIVLSNDGSLTITGGSLIGGDGNGLILNTIGSLSVGGRMLLGANTLLTQGDIDGSGSIFNVGSIDAQNSTLSLINPTVDNYGTIRKTSGAQTLRFTGDLNNYEDILIDADTISVTGNLTNYGDIEMADFTFLDVSTNGMTNTLTGEIISAGTINGNITNEGILGAGNEQAFDDTATLTINGNLVLTDTSVLVVDIEGVNKGVDYDLIAINGDLTIAGTVVMFWSGSSAIPSTYDLVEITGTVTGDASSFKRVVVPVGVNDVTPFTLVSGSPDVLRLSANTLGNINFFTFNVSDNWADAANWSLGLPTATDFVVVNDGIVIDASYTVAGAQIDEDIELSDVGQLTLNDDSLITGDLFLNTSNGIVTNGELLIAGYIAWLDGDFSGTGSLVIHEQGFADVFSAANINISVNTTNDGRIRSNGIFGTTGITLTNNGRFEFESGSASISDSFVNNGTTSFAANAANIVFNNSGYSQNAGGITLLDDGGFTSSQIVFNGGELTGNGTIIDTGIGITNNGATIKPGGTDNIGTINFNGDYVQTSGSIEIEVASDATAGQDYDLLAISGQADLSGDLTLLSVQGYAVSANDTIVPVTYGSIITQSLTFTDIGGETIDETYNATNLSLLLDATFVGTVWTGAIDNDWNDIGNWNNGIPTSVLDALIPVGSTVEITTTVEALSLTLDSGSSLTITAGQLTLGSTSTLNGAFNLAGGTLINNATTTINNAFNWTDGALAGTGSVITNGTSTLTFTGNEITNVDWTNNGTVSWGGTGNLSIGNSATITNASGAVFNINNASAIGVNSGTTLDNQGTIEVNVTGASISGSGDFNNSGIVDLNSTNTFSLSVAGTDSGNLILAGGTLAIIGSTRFINDGFSLDDTPGTIQINGGVLNINTTSELLLPATPRLQLSSGTLDGTGDLRLLGILDVDNGGIAGSGLLTTVNANNTIDSAGTLTVGRSWNNQGTIDWQSGTISFTNGATFTNLAGATLNIDTASNLLVNSGTIFDNQGTVEINVTGASSSGSGAFNNNGLIDLNTANTFSLSVTGIDSGTWDTGTGIITLNGGIRTLNDGFNVIGTGLIDILSATVDVNTSSELTLPATVRLGMRGGSITGTGDLRLLGEFDVDNGTLGGSGLLTTANATNTIDHAGTFTVGRSWDNEGTISWGAGALSLSNGAVFTNEAGATFAINTASIASINSGTTFDNQGTVTVGTTGASFTGSGTLTNSGLIDLNASTFSIGVTGNDIGTWDLATNSLVLTGGIRTLLDGFSVVDSNGSIQINGGTLTIGSSSELELPALPTLFLQNGIINGTGDLRLLGILDIDNGSLGGSGLLTTVNAANTVDHSGTLSIGRNWTNEGTITWQSGSISLSSSSTFTNAAGAVFDIDESLSMSVNSGTTFDNQGTVVVNGFSPDFTGSGTFTNSGLIDVNGLNLDLGVSGTDIGTWNLAGGTLQLDGGIRTLNDGFSVNPTSGTIEIAGGVLNVNTSSPVVISSPTVTLISGSIDGTGTLNLTGQFNWNGGSLLGSGLLITAGDANIGSVSILTVNRDWTINGTADLDAPLSTGNNSTLTIGATGTLTVSNGNDLSINSGTVFANQGTLEFSNNGSVFSGSGSLNNTGIIDLNGNSASISMSGTDSGTWTLDGGTLTLGGGIRTINDGFSVTNTTGTIALTTSTLSIETTSALTLPTNITLAQSGGILQGTGDLQIDGSYNWTGGTLSGSGLLSTTSATNTVSGASLSLGRSWTNSGTINWSDAVVTTSNSSTLTNLNAGIINFSGSANTLSVSSGTVFNNQGTLNVNTATSIIGSGSYQQNDGIIDLGGAVFTANVTMLGGVLQGDGTINGTLDNQLGTIEPGGSGTIGKITVTGTFLQSSTGTLNIDVDDGGSVPGADHDQLEVVSPSPTAATLGGDLGVFLVNGTPPADITVLTVSGGGGISGTFDFTSIDTGLDPFPDYQTTLVDILLDLGGTYIFTNGNGNGNWLEAGNWLQGSIPGLSGNIGVDVDLDNFSVTLTGGTVDIGELILGSSASLTLDGSTTLIIGTDSSIAGTLNMIGSQLNIAGTTFTVNGNMNLSASAQINGGGTGILATGLSASVVETGTGSRRLDNLTVNHDGTWTRDGTTSVALLLANADFNNNGNFVIDSDRGVNRSGSGNFNNNAGATLNLNNAGITEFTAAFASSNSAINMTAGGTLRLSLGGGTFSNTTTLTGGTLNLVSGTSTLTTGANLSGTTVVDLGFSGQSPTLNISGNSSIDNLTLTSGTLNFTSAVTLTVNNNLTWSGDTAIQGNGIGTFRMANGSIAQVSGAVTHIMDNVTVTNDGNWSVIDPGSVFRFDNGTVFDNNDTLTLDNGIGLSTSGGGVLNNNSGSVLAIDSDALIPANIAVNNSATTIDLAPGANLTTTNDLVIDSSSLLQGEGTIFGNVLNSGTVDPAGESTIGVLTINGNYTHDSATATILIDVANNTGGPGSGHDQLVIIGNGDISAGGSVVLNPLGYSAANNDSFLILSTSGTLTGTLGSFSGIGGATISPTYNADNLTVTLTTGLTNYVWISGADGEWNNAANWNLGIPGIGDSVSIGNFNITITGGGNADTLSIGSGGSLTLVSGTFTLGSSSTIDAIFNLDGGTLANAQNVVLANTFNWNGGTVTGTAGQSFTIPSGITANITASNSDVLLDTVNMLVDSGATANFSSSANDFDLNNGAVLTNDGTFNLLVTSGGADIDSDNIAAVSIINTGIINSAPSTNIDFFLPFDNQGTVNVNNGEFRLNGATTNSGTFNITGGNTLVVDDGTNSSLTLLAGTSITGTGNFIVDDDTTLDVSVPVVLPTLMTLVLNDTALIDNAQNLTIPNTFTWTGGTVKGQSGQTFTVPATATVTMTAATGDVILDTVNMSSVAGSTVNFTSAGNDLLLNNGAVWTNDGTFNVQNTSGSADIINDNIAVVSLINAGTMNVDSVNTNLDLFTPFDNQGTINIINNGGSGLFLNNPSTSSGSIVIAGGVSLGVDNGTNSSLTLTGGSISGSGTLSVDTDAVLIIDGTVGLNNDFFALNGGLQILNGNTANFANAVGGTSIASTNVKITLAGGATLSFPQLLTAIDLGAGSVLEGDGTLNNSVDNTAGTVIVGGSGTVGTLTLNGNYLQDINGQILFEFSGTNFDVLSLQSGGTATLAGDLTIDELTPYTGGLAAFITAQGGFGASDFTGKRIWPVGYSVPLINGNDYEIDNLANNQVFFDNFIGNADWNDANNWSSGLLPTASEDIILNDADATVNLVTALTVSGGTHIIGNLNGGTGVSFSNTGGSLIVNGTSSLDGDFTNSGAGAASTFNGATNFSTITVNSGTATFAANTTATSIDNSGDLTLANGATGLITNDGDMNISGNFTSASAFNHIGGTVTVLSSGTTVIDSGIVMSGSAPVLSVQGTLDVTGAPATGVNNVNGTITGVGTIDGNVFNNGVLSPGNSIGVLTINGDLTLQADSNLNFEIDGGDIAGVDYDQLIVNGNILFDGALALQLPSGSPVLQRQQTITPISFSTATTDTEFDSVVASSGYSFADETGTTDVVLTALRLPGDVDVDPVGTNVVNNISIAEEISETDVDDVGPLPPVASDDEEEEDEGGQLVCS